MNLFRTLLSNSTCVCRYRTVGTNDVLYEMVVKITTLKEGCYTSPLFSPQLSTLALNLKYPYFVTDTNSRLIKPADLSSQTIPQRCLS